MKKLMFLISGSVLCLSLSCVKPVVRLCCVLAQRSAEMTAQRNGVLWSANAVKTTLSGDSLTLVAGYGLAPRYDITHLIDTLHISIFYTGPGIYKLSSKQVFYGTHAYKSNAITVYKADPAFDNEVTITSYEILHNPATTNPDPAEIKGTLSLKFIDPKNTGGLSFTNGSFYSVMPQ